MKVMDFFLEKYSPEEYLLYARVKLLLIFEFIMLVGVFFLQFSMLFAGWEDFIKTLFITPLIFLGMIAAMYMLKQGNYNVSSKTVITICSIAIITGLIREPFMNPEYALTSYIFFVYPCLTLCVVFSTTGFLAVITILFIITDIAVFMIMKEVAPGVNMKQLVIFLNNTIFSFIFFWIISLLISKIFNKNVDLVMMESDKNIKNYDFIKKVLGQSSAAITASMRGMSERSDLFSQNTNDLSSSIEEITANIEEISGGIENIAGSAIEQDSDVNSISVKISDFSDIIQEMGGVVTDSLTVTSEITEKAKRGENSLMAMEQNVARIGESSQQMKNIVAIINDISDRINLLSLNAAIEAARAGDAGRGFAVVADEISKLADRTATSIKEITELITANEQDTGKGAAVIRETAEIIRSILAGVDAMNSRISSIATYRDKQTNAGMSVISSIKNLKGRAEFIMKAVADQRNGIEDILRHISEINNISSSNTTGALKLHEDSEELVVLMNNFQKTIDEYSH